MGNDPLWMRLRKIKWADCGLSDKQGKKVDGLLQDLASRKEKRAMRASQELWLLLKPGAPLGPVIKPFLIDIRAISSGAVQMEIDDLLGRITSDSKK